MKSKLLLSVIVILGYSHFSYLNSLAIPLIQSGNSTDAFYQKEKWVQRSDFGFPVQIALNSAPPGKTYLGRTIYLFVEEKYFNQNNLQQVLSCLAEDYEQPYSLTIYAFSKEEAVKQAIRLHLATGSVSFLPTKEGKEAERKFYEIYPYEGQGYFRATYYRGNGERLFFYSVDPTKEEMLKIKLN